jgi:predicted 2-oxoglutarate/Fe(II)-dependent dioxygenase YbiX
MVLQRNALRHLSGLPLRIFPPPSTYEGGQSFGNHRQRHPADHRHVIPIRTDSSLRSFSVSPTSMTAVNWPWKTPTACNTVKLPAGQISAVSIQ